MVAPSGILGVSLDRLGRLHVDTRKDFFDGHELALEGVPAELDGFGQGLEVGVVVACAFVEVAVEDVGHVEGVGGPEGHGAGVVAGVGFQDGPGEVVVVLGYVYAVVGEVAAFWMSFSKTSILLRECKVRLTEVGRSSKSKNVKAVVRRLAGLVIHGRSHPARGVCAPVAEERVLPLLEAGIRLFITGKSAPLQREEVLGHFTLHGDLVVVLQIRADTGQVLDDLDAVPPEFGRGSDAAQLKDLG